MSQCCFFQCAVCGTVPSVPDPESRAPEAIDWLPLKAAWRHKGWRRRTEVRFGKPTRRPRGLRAPRPRSPDAPLPQGMPAHLRESDVAFACASYLCPWCRHPRNFDNRDGDERDDTSEEDAQPPPRQTAVRRPPNVDRTAAGSDAVSDDLGASGRRWKAFAEDLEAQIAGLRTELSLLKKRKTESKKKRDDRRRLAAASRNRTAQLELTEEVRGRFRRPGPVAESGRS